MEEYIDNYMGFEIYECDGVYYTYNNQGKKSSEYEILEDLLTAINRWYHI